MDGLIQLYCNVDNEGNIIESYYGPNILPDVAYDFFFMVEEQITDNLDQYKVILNGFKASLVLK
jgi:hypothetical protein